VSECEALLTPSSSLILSSKTVLVGLAIRLSVGESDFKFRELSAERRGVKRHELTSRVVVSFDFVAGDILDMLGGLVDVCSRWENPYCYRAVGRIWTLTRVNR
jgi:hypothetical protein